MQLSQIILPITNYYKHLSACIVLIFVFLIFTTSCNLFNTRTPEEPTVSRGIFVPPTKPEYVIDNFKNSIRQKVADNFLACLIDYNQSDVVPTIYQFVPSAEANAKYQDIFKNWDKNKERTAFIALISILPDSVVPRLEITGDFTIKISDSAVYSGSYFLEFQHNNQDQPKRFSGSLQFTMFPQNGRWAIQRWIDASITNDTVNTTWSILKALNSN